MENTMLIDLTCPAEIFRVEPPGEDRPAAVLTLFNLSDRVISSAEVLLRLCDADGNETERLSFRGRALNGRPHSTFQMNVPCAADAGVKKIEATVEKVWFTDNDVWRRNPANAVAYTPNALPVSPALTNLRFAAGETAVGFPSRQEGLWVCVCGRPNPEGEEYCARCGQRQDTVFARFSPEAVGAQINLQQRRLDLNSRSMREDTIRLQRIREAEYKQAVARRGRRLRLSAFFALALLLVAGTVFFGVPGLRYLAANRALSDGRPAEAKAVFEDLGSFADSAARADDCAWQIALKAAEESDTAEALAEAGAALRAMENRPEALEKANETDMLRARLLLAGGDWLAAEQALAQLPADYEGREALLREIRFAEARSLFSGGEYVAARELFLSLGDDPEARKLAAECLYRPAKEQIAREDWAGAIETLSAIQDYSDARNLTLECHYRLGLACEEAGDLEGAGREYLMAGDWGDASDRVRGLTYLQAESFFALGDLKSAQPLYASIPDYLDSNAKEQACRYRLASAAADDREYTLALELLSGIPDDYEKTRSLRTEASYQKAKAAVKQEDWNTAVELLKDIDRQALRRKHKDVEDLYLRACEAAGIEPYPATPDPDAEQTPAPEQTPTPEPTPEQTPTPAPFLVTEDETPEPTANAFLVTEEDGHE